MKILNRRTYPCGADKAGKLKNHLEHYQTCSDEGCKLRSKTWTKVIDNFSNCRLETTEN